MSVKAGSSFNPDNIKDSGAERKIEEVVVVRVTVYNPLSREVVVGPRYRYLLRGRTSVAPKEALVIRYPVTALSRSKAVTELERQFPELEVGSGLNSVREI